MRSGLKTLCAAAGVLVAAMLLASCAATQFAPFAVERFQPADLENRLSSGFKLYAPDGVATFPVVIAVHGCGGPHRNIDDYAQRANALGVGLLSIDSFGPRGLSYNYAVANVCKGRDLWGRERAGDVLVALEYARGLEAVEDDNLALLGWSHGGWAIMDLLSMDLRKQLPTNLADAPPGGVRGVKAAMLLYPYCGFPSLTRKRGWAHDVAAEFILVEDDFVADERACLEAIEKLRAQGRDVSYEVYSGVTHAFDEIQFPESRQRFDAEAQKKALDAFERFLRKYLLDDQLADDANSLY